MAAPMQLSASASSSAKTGDFANKFGSDSSGFNVNYGSGTNGGTTAGLPWELVLGAMLVGLVLWKMK